ncbi:MULTISPECIES: histidine kinase [unclassified Thiocapsa]|uniref:histidine kinase n=1 Tax=unclassified Thiocapsa TaxID=2641286 RepID=UPI0035B375FC
MRSVLPSLLHRSLLISVGLLMSLILLLGILSMLITGVVAQTTEGLASAVNQSGSLRMQSYRIGMVLAESSVPARQRADQVSALVAEFEQRLASPRLTHAIPLAAGDPVRAAYEGVRWTWAEQMHPALYLNIEQLREPAGARPAEGLAALSYHLQVDRFVEQIDDLVGRLEAVAEGRIAMLRLVQIVALALTLVAVLITMILVRHRVIVPLGELLRCADSSRRGDFSRRTPFTGADELGRLGEAINRMAEDLARLYAGLEERVADRTQDLEQANQSLELLYRVGKRLHESAVSRPLFECVLAEIQGKLGLQGVSLALWHDPDKGEDLHRISALGNRSPCGAESHAGGLDDSNADAQEHDSAQAQIPAHTAAALGTALGDVRHCAFFPVTNQGQELGVMIVDPGDCRDIPLRQRRLLTSLAARIGTALGLHQRQRDARRLSVYEERTTIARELHDSLAQSLSYLKIQAARLDARLAAETNADPAQAREVLADLRDGISNAYSQLRELLTTFRLKVDDRGLNAALNATVTEYRARGETQISLDNRLAALLLTPNEEIHVLQIVREALSNVFRHAGAARASLRLTAVEDEILVTIEDNGRGIPALTIPAGHYGLQIMRERAASLGGAIEIGPGLHRGTRVQLRFPSRSPAQGEHHPTAITPP